mmetsp:Transcript_40169/g.76782  ORF Transcript_40169/g.76782 Transcript_40169/m.76782 type:complete len:641 (-) Transcript_40169:474-2396(-)
MKSASRLRLRARCSSVLVEQADLQEDIRRRSGVVALQEAGHGTVECAPTPGAISKNSISRRHLKTELDLEAEDARQPGHRTQGGMVDRRFTLGGEGGPRAYPKCIRSMPGSHAWIQKRNKRRSVSDLSPEQIRELHNCFVFVDSNMRGSLTPTELEQALSLLNVEVPEDVLKATIQECRNGPPAPALARGESEQEGGVTFLAFTRLVERADWSLGGQSQHNSLTAFKPVILAHRRRKMFENIMGDVSLDRFQLLEDIIAVDRGNPGRIVHPLEKDLQRMRGLGAQDTDHIQAAPSALEKRWRTGSKLLGSEASGQLVLSAADILDVQDRVRALQQYAAAEEASLQPLGGGAQPTSVPSQSSRVHRDCADDPTNNLAASGSPHFDPVAANSPGGGARGGASRLMSNFTRGNQGIAARADEAGAPKPEPSLNLALALPHSIDMGGEQDEHYATPHRATSFQRRAFLAPLQPLILPATNGELSPYAAAASSPMRSPSHVAGLHSQSPQESPIWRRNRSITKEESPARSLRGEDTIAATVQFRRQVVRSLKPAEASPSTLHDRPKPPATKLSIFSPAGAAKPRRERPGGDVEGGVCVGTTPVSATNVLRLSNKEASPTKQWRGSIHEFPFLSPSVRCVPSRHLS